jgi:hypothetical protein
MAPFMMDAAPWDVQYVEGYTPAPKGAGAHPPQSQESPKKETEEAAEIVSVQHGSPS